MTLPLAAIVHDGHGVAEPIMQAFVQRLLAQGVRVRGLLQISEVEMTQTDAGTQCQRHMELLDIAQGERYLISQDLGKGSTACCLDSAGIVAASVVLRRELSAEVLPDVMVANRFGKIEVEGSGLRQEIAAAVEAGIPLVTAVDQRFLSEWQAFSGGMAQNLTPSVEALEQWWQAIAAPTHLHEHEHALLADSVGTTAT